MVDTLTKEQRHYNMSQIKSKDTKPEMMLRKYLFSKGLRGYRIHYNLPGKPDIVFTKDKIAIFVDGCFWHKCPECFKQPETNQRFWSAKLGRNIERDKEVNQQLSTMGYTVIRFWEHEIMNNLSKCYSIIIETLKSRHN